jgi:opacity protein-like surface antigen
MLHRSRFVSRILVLFSLATPVWFTSPSTAQLRTFDGAVNIVGQFSSNTTGNGIQDKPTDSLGVVVSGRQMFHYWLGYEVNYGYTRFAERYSAPGYGIQVQDNLHEATAAYLIHGPTIPLLGLQPFAGVGVGILAFLPTSVGGQRYTQQYRVPILYEVGANFPLFTSHLGLRLQYRALNYKVPDFGDPQLTLGARRQTGEPSVGAYFHF